MLAPHILRELWIPLAFWKVPIRLLGRPLYSTQSCKKPWDRLDVGHLPPASCCRPAMQRLFRAATDAPTNMHCKSISGQYCKASVQKPIVDSVQNCPKCPTSQLWAFKIGTSGGMKSILHSQNSPKMWELAFESRMLYHSVKFWMIFNV